MCDATPSPPTPHWQPRDRFQRARVLALTPRERLAAMQRLIDESWSVLGRHPEGLAHFRRRNFRARSVGRPPEPCTDGA